MSKTIEREAAIACEACDEGQPMPLGKADGQIVAGMCEMKGEVAYTQRDWKKAATCFRMAIHYFKKELA